MKQNIKVLLQGLGIVVACCVLVLVVVNISWARQDEARRARLKEMELKIQALTTQRMQIEAERAGEKAVHEYDMKNASQAELGRMYEAHRREIERLDAIIRVEKGQ